MLGIFLIYFIGKAYYELAHEYNRSRWGFAILGVVAYYGGTFIAGIVFALLSEFGVSDFFMELPDMALSFIALPIGLLTCWALYRILSNNWSNQSMENKNESLDSDMVRPPKE